MPIYEYRCNNGHTFEVFQSMSDDPVEVCEECGAPVERVFHPVAVHFKGSGFYTTDYAGKSKVGAGGESGDSGGDSGSSSGKKSSEGSGGGASGKSGGPGESKAGGSGDSGSSGGSAGKAKSASSD